jgi:bisphosphoglycerate-independent phosphoglycerate mutase (AlkP superfamily)
MSTYQTKERFENEYEDENGDAFVKNEARGDMVGGKIIPSSISSSSCLILLVIIILAIIYK